MKKIYILLFIFLVFNLLFCDLYAKHDERRYNEMAINLVTAPTGGAPLSTDDYDNQNGYIYALLLSIDQNTLHLTEWDTLTVPKLKEDVYIQHGGALFQVQSTDYTIGGAPSNGRVYIKIARSGDTLVATFVNSAAGYTWNEVYNGFYSGSDQLLPYILYKTASGYEKYLISNLEDPYDISSKLWLEKEIELGDWDMDATTTLNVTHGITDWKNIRSVNVIIKNDNDNQYYPIDQYIGSSFGFWYLTSSFIVLNRVVGGGFDSLSYDSTSFNRGWVFLKYYI